MAMSSSTGEPGAPALVETAAVGAAGALMLSTGFVPWVRRGSGSSFAGIELADVLRNGTVTPSWGWAAGGAIYGCLAIGCGVLASSSARGRVAATTRMAFATAVLFGAVLVVIAGWFPPGRWAIGPALCVLGAIAIAVTSTFQLRREERA
jgi:hypothetical protein